MANILIKRKTGASTYEDLYAASKVEIITNSGGTTLQALLDAKINTSARGAANGVAPLDGSSKVPLANLPSFLTGAGKGFFLAGTLASNTALDGVGGLNQLLSGLVPSGAGYSNVYGAMWVATAQINITWTDQTALNPNTFHVLTPGDEADATSPVTLEAGDMIVFTKYSGTAGDGDDNQFTYSILNNTYNVATSSIAGITTLSDGNGAVITGLTGNTVITEGNLIGMVYTAGTNLNGLTGNDLDKLAKTNHTHSNYQTVDATLTALAGLTTTNDQIIYTTATDAFAMSTITSFGRSILDDADGAAVRTTIGAQVAGSYQPLDGDLTAIAALAGTSGFLKKTAADTYSLDTNSYQLASGFLTTLAGLSKTDGNFVVTDGTTFVAESGATARTSLGVYSTTQVDSAIADKPNIYYDLAKTTADSTAPIGSYIYDDLSTSNGW